jgi:hypothetical protein
MAKQLGFLQLSGKVGDLVYYLRNGKQMVRRMPRFDKDRFKNNPHFSRWRANCAQFGKAGKAGKLLRASLSDQLRSFKDNTMITRLSGEMLKVIKSDDVNEPGLRRIADGNLQLLEGFNFNSQMSLMSTLRTTIGIRWDRRGGTATIIPEPFIPAKQVRQPRGATHFTLSGIGVLPDFDKERCTVAIKTSDHLSCNTKRTLDIELMVETTRETVLSLLLLLRISFFRMQNEALIPFCNGAKDALTIISVNTV